MGSKEKEKEKRSPGIEKIIKDAKAKGYIVREHRFTNAVDIRKGTTRYSIGITIWEDGTATRSDVYLTVASTIRTQKEMRKTLGL